MSRPTFADYVRIEQVRLLQGDEAGDNNLGINGQNFDAALHSRARLLVREHDWERLLTSPQQWYQRSLLAAGLLFAVLGVVAVINALSSSGSNHLLNIYWLLLVLLGFNSLSILLWVFGCLANIGGLISGTLGSIPLSLQRIMARWRNNAERPALQAWYDSLFSGSMGVWRLSTVSHALWLVYLGSGLLALLVMFSVRQYDFVWGSTLLSADFFIALTNGLAQALQLFGLSIPDAQTIVASRSGDGVVSDSIARRQWALFLLGAIVLYGLLPRLLCAGLAYMLLRQQERNFRPDYYLPYYVDLRHQLVPEFSESEVVDPDAHPSPVQESAGRPLAPAPAIAPGALLIGYELDAVAAALVTINILNSADLSRAQQYSQQATGPVALVVEGRNLPDRGVKRELASLLANPGGSYLLLHQPIAGNTAEAKTSEQRLRDWYRLAAQLKVPAEQVGLLSTEQLAKLGT